jgi:hypothetical protein
MRCIRWKTRAQRVRGHTQMGNPHRPGREDIPSLITMQLVVIVTTCAGLLWTLLNHPAASHLLLRIV